MSKVKLTAVIHRTESRDVGEDWKTDYQDFGVYEAWDEDGRAWELDTQHTGARWRRNPMMDAPEVPK